MRSYFNSQIMNGHVLNIGATPVHLESCSIPEGTRQKPFLLSRDYTLQDEQV